MKTTFALIFTVITLALWKQECAAADSTYIHLCQSGTIHFSGVYGLTISSNHSFTQNMTTIDSSYANLGYDFSWPDTYVTGSLSFSGDTFSYVGIKDYEPPIVFERLKFTIDTTGRMLRDVDDTLNYHYVSSMFTTDMVNHIRIDSIGYSFDSTGTLIGILEGSELLKRMTIVQLNSRSSSPQGSGGVSGGAPFDSTRSGQFIIRLTGLSTSSIHHKLPSEVAVSSYPNPVATTLYLNVRQKIDQTEIRIYDLLGRLRIVRKAPEYGQASIDIRTLENGSYIIMLGDFKKLFIVSR